MLSALARLFAGGLNQASAHNITHAQQAAPGNMQAQVNITQDDILAVNRTVPKVLWMHLSLEEIKKYGKKYLSNQSSTKEELAVLLCEKKVLYSNVQNKHLRAMCAAVDANPSDNKTVMARRLHEALNPPPATAAASAEKKQKAPKPKPEEGGPPKNMTQAVQRLVKEANKPENQGRMTKEACAVQLHKWGHLDPSQDAVYHIVSPLEGGVDHPRNFCVLPNYIPTDYHMGAGKAKLHHFIVLRMLELAVVRAAVKHSVGEEQADAKLAKLQADAKGKGKYCAPVPGTSGSSRKRPKAPNGGDAAAAASGAGQDASKASQSDGAGPSKRPRGEGEEEEGMQEG